MAAVWDVAQHRVAGVRTEPPIPGHYDVAVVGGGVTGLTCALHLAEAGQRVIVLEASRIGAGATGHSTGNLYSTLAEGLAPLARKWGEDTARRVVDLRARAVDWIEATVEREGIDCAFGRRPLYLAAGAPEDRQRWLRAEFDLSCACGIDAALTDQAAVAHGPGTVLRQAHQAQLNPRSYTNGLAATAVRSGAAVHEDSPVTEIDADSGRVAIGATEIRAGAVIQATHTPKGLSVLQTALLPYREYGVAGRLERSAYPEGITWLSQRGLSMRRYRHDAADYLLAIGAKHKTGHAPTDIDPHEQLAAALRTHADVAEVEHRWSAQQFVAADHLPYIGRAPGTDAGYLATGFASDGLVWGTVAGLLIGDLVLERAPAEAELLAPTRLTPAKSARNWVKENRSVASHFTRDRLTGEQVEQLGEITSGEGRVVTLGGEKLAVCRDHNGRLSVLSAVCPHMRCLVHWNGADATWDCPCHGSRFRADGRVLEGPAYAGLAPRAAQDG